MYTAIRKVSYFAIKLVNFLAPKLIQYVIAIGSIKSLDTGSYFAINLVNFLAPKLIQHVIAIGSIKNLDTGSYFALKFGEFSSIKVDSRCTSIKVGSPNVSWVKQWSKTKDYLQTFFIDKYFFYRPYQRKHLSWSKV